MTALMTPTLRSNIHARASRTRAVPRTRPRLFEIVVRDGAARIGRLHTLHGSLQTPTLLPVINPNLRTIEPREMWEKYGVDALITNSYVIWKHDDLKEKALSDGIHSLLDYPGVVMTDSGTFQSYVYGDVEVGVGEIVDFQRDIGVDIGTMLDVFGRPDMSREELEDCVQETASRASRIPTSSRKEDASQWPDSRRNSPRFEGRSCESNGFGQRRGQRVLRTSSGRNRPPNGEAEVQGVV